MSHNVLFFLTPKAMCQFVYDDFTVRQALEKMESSGYTALPILNKRGEYRGTLSETRRIMEISRRRDNIPVRVTTSMRDLVERAVAQNFVPVVDDKDTFIGLITRKAIISYCRERLFPED